MLSENEAQENFNLNVNTPQIDNINNEFNYQQPDNEQIEEIESELNWQSNTTSDIEESETQWAQANINGISAHLDQIHQIQNEMKQQNQSISTWLFNETQSTQDLNRMKQNCFQRAQQTNAQHIGRPKGGIYVGSDNYFEGKEIQRNVIKTWISGVITIIAYTNSETRHDSLMQYIRRLVTTNNKPVIFIIDANERKDQQEHLCKNILDMNMLPTGFTYYRRNSEVKSKNDLIFFKNVDLSLVKQFSINDPEHQSDHTPIVFKVSMRLPKLIKPFYHQDKVYNDKNKFEIFKKSFNDIFNNDTNEHNLYVKLIEGINHASTETKIKYDSKQNRGYRVFYNKEVLQQFKDQESKINQHNIMEEQDEERQLQLEYMKQKRKMSQKNYSEQMQEQSKNNNYQAILKRMIRRGTLKPNGKSLKGYKNLKPMMGNGPEEFFNNWETVQREKFAERQREIDNIEFIEKVYKTNEQGEVIVNLDDENQKKDIIFSVEEVEVLFKNLNQKKSPGSDGISQGILKLAFECNKENFTRMLNYELNSEELHEDFRKMDIFPIYKTGSQSEPNNFRPIAASSAFFKLLEMAFSHKVNVDNCIGEHQHGFQTGRGTHTYIKAIQDAMNSFHGGGVIVKIDVRKAFDEIDRNIAMLKQLNSVGQYKFLFKVKKLQEQTNMRIITDFGVSHWIEAFVGIMQGSRISPTIFTNAIDDILNSLNDSSECKFLAQADDIVIIGPRNKAIIRRAVSSLGLMLRKVGLEISEDKLEWIRYGGYSGGTNTITFKRGLAKIHSKYLRIVGYFIKNNCDFRLDFHLKTRRAQSGHVQDDINIQKHVKKAILLDLPARKTIFIGRFAQRYYQGANILCENYLEAEEMNESSNPEWQKQGDDLNADIKESNLQQARDALVLIDGQNYAKNLAANMLLKPLHVKKASEKSIFMFWIWNNDNQTSNYQLENYQALIDMSKNKAKDKLFYKVLKYYSGHIESLVHQFRSIDPIDYPRCKECLEELDMDCFDQDLKPCRTCGLWLEGKVRTNRQRQGLDQELLDTRIKEINKGEWAHAAKKVKMQQMFNAQSVFSEEKQDWVQNGKTFQEYMNQQTNNLEDIHLDTDDQYADQYEHNYDLVNMNPSRQNIESSIVDNREDYDCVEIYTDGSSSSRDSFGAIGVVFANHDIEDFAEPVNEQNKSNNACELKAVLRALEVAYQHYSNRRIRVSTDSEQVISAITSFKLKWKYKVNRLNRNQLKVKNLALIERIYNHMELKNDLNELMNTVCFRKVKAHTANPVEFSAEQYNEMADKLARDHLRQQIEDAQLDGGDEDDSGDEGDDSDGDEDDSMNGEKRSSHHSHENGPSDDKQDSMGEYSRNSDSDHGGDDQGPTEQDRIDDEVMEDMYVDNTFVLNQYNNSMIDDSLNSNSHSYIHFMQQREFKMTSLSFKPYFIISELEELIVEKRRHARDQKLFEFRYYWIQYLDKNVYFDVKNPSILNHFYDRRNGFIKIIHNHNEFDRYNYIENLQRNRRIKQQSNKRIIYSNPIAQDDIYIEENQNKIVSDNHNLNLNEQQNEQCDSVYQVDEGNVREGQLKLDNDNPRSTNLIIPKYFK